MTRMLAPCRLRDISALLDSFIENLPPFSQAAVGDDRPKKILAVLYSGGEAARNPRLLGDFYLSSYLTLQYKASVGQTSSTRTGQGLMLTRELVKNVRASHSVP